MLQRFTKKCCFWGGWWFRYFPVRIWRVGHL